MPFMPTSSGSDQTKQKGARFILILGFGGMVVGAVMGVTGERFDWWVWPLGTLGGMALGALLGSWAYHRTRIGSGRQ